MRRGDICWAQLPEPVGSEPGYRRPVLIVQSNAFNQSRIRTVIAVTITSNTALAAAPGNVSLPADSAGLDRDSVINISQIVTLDREFISEPVGRIGTARLGRVEEGLRLVLSLA